MSGKVIKQAVLPHACNPGWTWRPIPDGDLPYRLAPGGAGGYYGTPPTLWEYPKGTVWRCDCGQVWVSEGQDRRSNRGGLLAWHKERWRERRKRLGLRWWQREDR